MKIITLSNGKKVGNFSSPHPFTFEDNNILPAVDDNEAKRLEIIFKEDDCGGGDVELSFSISNAVISEMKVWEIYHEKKEVDVVFCPLPMITAIRNIYGREWLMFSPFRAIRMVNRINKQVSISKQCL